MDDTFIRFWLDLPDELVLLICPRTCGPIRFMYDARQDIVNMTYETGQSKLVVEESGKPGFHYSNTPIKTYSEPTTSYPVAMTYATTEPGHPHSISPGLNPWAYEREIPGPMKSMDSVMMPFPPPYDTTGRPIRPFDADQGA